MERFGGNSFQNIPRPSKGCFLEAFRYLKPTKRHSFGGPGTDTNSKFPKVSIYCFELSGLFAANCGLMSHAGGLPLLWKSKSRMLMGLVFSWLKGFVVSEIVWLFFSSIFWLFSF